MSRPVYVQVENLDKSFVLHTQGGVELPVLQDINLRAHAGECLVLHGPSGAGKSTLLRCLYGNYLADGGSIRVRSADAWVELAGAEPRTVLALRRGTLGYVSQFLRAVPRVSAVDVVAEPLRQRGVDKAVALGRATALLERLDIPAKLWSLAPATFSGGEQQRVNIARGLIAELPVLLLDEPTAALDRRNRDEVVALIRDAVARGTAVIGIFHDPAVRERLADRVYEVPLMRTAA